ncbi:MAG: mucoidy inhibitor MuiA family protein [Phycisphaerales bacterium JB063]
MIRRHPHRLSWAAVLAVLLLVTYSTHAQEAPRVESKVTEVTLYRDQAQITRTLQVPAGQGPIEIIVPGMPDQMVASSLFAEGGDAVDVRAVQTRQRVVEEEPREDIRELDEQLRAIEEEIETNTAMQQLVLSQLEYLDKLEGFVAPTATAELSQGVLDAAQLRESTQFIFEQRTESTQTLLGLRSEARELQRTRVTLQNRRNLAAGRSQNTVRDAVLYLDRRQEEAATIRLTYLVRECGWAPSYNVRGNLADATVRVEYNALIRQRTGEDWTGVTLTLSTASPMISASGPAMASFPVMLQQAADGGRPGASAPGGFGGRADLAYDEIQSRQRDAITRNNNAMNLSDNLDASWQGNQLAAQAQVLELSAGLAALNQAAQPGGGPIHALSISYTLDGPVTLESRNDQQMTRIMQAEMDGTFYHVASPVLTSFVYREAEVANSSGRDLLAGPVSVYLDGLFVGRTEMVSVTRGQRFVLGFGADPQLHAKRQLVARDEDAQGGNTLLGFEYRLAIENYGDQPANVRVMDRIPTFRDGDDVKVTIGTMSEPLSDDAAYLRLRRPDGILRWDTTVAANAAGEDAHVIRYEFDLAFDRNFVLSTGDMDALRTEFEEQERNRRGR